ncbi:hypothetical protein AAVH_30072 [Aphelenchoides avenae]|nr:hypothetical protein AAVH_30072 [Aphelenchus avenae]
MLKYEAEASHLRTQLQREQEKVQKAVAVREHYEAKYDEERKRANDAEAKGIEAAQLKVAAAEKKAMDLRKQCERLEAKVLSNEAEVNFRDKQLGNAAKELNEARKKADDGEKEAAEAKKKATDAEQKAAEADTKRKVAETEASDLKQKLEEMKKNKTAEERKLNSEDHWARGSACWHADKDMLKKDLKASRAKATRLENAGKKAVDEILSLKERIVVLENELNGPAEPILYARLQTTRFQQAIGRFAGISDKIMLKYDNGGVSIKSNPSRSSRSTLPKAVLELKPSFFDEYDCRKEYLAQTDYSVLSQGFSSQAGREQCRMYSYYGHSMGINFEGAEEEDCDVSENAPYACTFEINSFVLARAAQKLSPVLFDLSNSGQSDAVAITDCEEHLDGDQREYLWRSLPGVTPHNNDFKAEFSSTMPDTHLRIYVDPKYLRRCVMATSGAGSKTVEVAMSEDTLRLRYGNGHFTLTYYIPTVKPTENGERCYSPIEFGTEIFEL